MRTNSKFEQDLINPTSSIAVDFFSDRSPWLIAFGGLAGELGMPPLEFVNVTRGIDVNKIFLRDFDQTWYQQGLYGMANDIDDIVSYLKQVIGISNSKNNVLIGNSMGGYAAMVCGILLDDFIVHAFSPQTFIDKMNRLRYLDVRWYQQIKKTHRIEHRKYLDLKKLVKSDDFGCEINIHYSPRVRLDKIHAERLCGIRNVKLHPVNMNDHNVAKHLRNSGELRKIIIGSLDDMG